ncbi:MAG: glucosaminidase domain-containing protein [Bacteroidales bacterium]|nr:glucosaminidase domain-containing protein [Bacteroidales bacterium]
MAIHKALILFISAISLTVGAQAQNRERIRYINKYKDLAVRQMKQYGIPASIIMAQACIESDNGKSALATRGNNHFGIKCHGWTGRTIRHNDDKRRECFRRYRNAEESFKDHSKFLRNGPRYQSLFKLKDYDYVRWAYGLKAAGYATNPQYAQILIGIIEKYQLYKLDGRSAPESLSGYDKTGTGEKLSKRELRRRRRAARKEERIARREARKRAKAAELKKAAEADIKKMRSSSQNDKSLEKKEIRTGSADNSTYEFSLKRKVYVKNGSKYIIATGRETYGSIAKEFSLFTRSVLKLNGVEKDGSVKKGTRVYISKRKK